MKPISIGDHLLVNKTTWPVLTDLSMSKLLLVFFSRLFVYSGHVMNYNFIFIRCVRDYLVDSV